ncbi:MAG: lipopolysaccharide heptosyltransferase II [Planctomycetes bacterium]|nr:lipopolysaccharide heptosyltransferase II [Planctomycetota bacterium]
MSDAAASAAERAPRDDARIVAPGSCVDGPRDDGRAGAASPARILVRLPSWVGDVVMATPALRALREAHPRAKVVVEGRAFLKGLVENLPEVDGFLASPGKGASAAWTHARMLRKARFDWAVLLPDSVRSALPARLAGIPRRVGYARDLLRRALLTDVLPPPMADGRRLPIPMPERYLRITRALGCDDPSDARTRLVVDAEAARTVVARLELAGLAGRRLVVVSPGASFGSSKLYPAAQLARALELLAERLGLHAVLAPGPGEEALAREVAGLASRPVTVFDAPVTTLRELVALTARAALALSNDTGPRHVAVALDVPAITLMGPTDPRHTAFQLERQRVLREDLDCAPCHAKTCPLGHHHCMTQLAPERVLVAARELLEDAA